MNGEFGGRPLSHQTPIHEVCLDIEHVCMCSQEQDKVHSDLFTAQAAKTRAESKAAQARHLSDARSVLSRSIQSHVEGHA